MTREDEIRRLHAQARSEVIWRSGRTPVRSALYHLTRGRMDWRPRPMVGDLPTLTSPWQDTVSGRYFGWRCRQANLRGDMVFVVEYIVCPVCKIGWVDKPYTVEEYQRRGLAAVGLSALRAEHPGLTWHTGSGHLTDSRSFWNSVGDGVPGGYRPRDLCLHVSHNGGLLASWERKAAGKSPG